ncbi:dihydroneopterin aldolase [Planctomicrobium sp. SH664]|uniref:dihydroneopterin aldolase n=1 Tax=Planctomicrobium sp. SH664 TaxID=3448125 RepID=UPI003F5B43BA
MPDSIEIKDLLLRTIIGINPEERENRQDVVISLRLQTDLRAAGESDDIAQTLNYRTLCKQIIELVEGSSFLLVERLAEAIAATCLKNDRVQRVWVTVEKPGALRFARTVGVQIERSRHD